MTKQNTLGKYLVALWGGALIFSLAHAAPQKTPAHDSHGKAKSGAFVGVDWGAQFLSSTMETAAGGGATLKQEFNTALGNLYGVMIGYKKIGSEKTGSRIYATINKSTYNNNVLGAGPATISSVYNVFGNWDFLYNFQDNLWFFVGGSVGYANYEDFVVQNGFNQVQQNDTAPNPSGINLGINVGVNMQATENHSFELFGRIGLYNMNKKGSIGGQNVTLTYNQLFTAGVRYIYSF